MTDNDVRAWADEQEAAFVLGISEEGMFLSIKGDTAGIISLVGMGIAELIKEAEIKPEEIVMMLNKVVEGEMQNGR